MKIILIKHLSADFKLRSMTNFFLMFKLNEVALQRNCDRKLVNCERELANKRAR